MMPSQYRDFTPTRLSPPAGEPPLLIVLTPLGTLPEK